MKNALYIIFRTLLVLVLIGKILNWFLAFSEEVNRVLNVTMFCLIGLAYITLGYAHENKLIRAIIMVCGTFLISMNFFESDTVITIIGIVSVLTPMLIAKFYKQTVA